MKPKPLRKTVLLHGARVEAIAGVPARRVRDWLRGVESGLYVEGVAADLHIARPAAHALVLSLEHLGYVKPGAWPGHWSVTEEGKRMRVSPPAPPIGRKRADALLVEVIARAARANEQRKFAYWIERVSIFGEYATDARRLCALPFGIELAAKESSAAKQTVRNNERARRRDDDSRNTADPRSLAQEEVFRFVRIRSPHVYMATTEAMRELHSGGIVVFDRRVERSGERGVPLGG